MKQLDSTWWCRILMIVFLYVFQLTASFNTGDSESSSSAADSLTKEMWNRFSSLNITSLFFWSLSQRDRQGAQRHVQRHAKWGHVQRAGHGGAPRGHRTCCSAAGETLRACQRVPRCEWTKIWDLWPPFFFLEELLFTLVCCLFILSKLQKECQTVSKAVNHGDVLL